MLEPDAPEISIATEHPQLMLNKSLILNSIHHRTDLSPLGAEVEENPYPQQSLRQAETEMSYGIDQELLFSYCR